MTRKELIADDITEIIERYLKESTKEVLKDNPNLISKFKRFYETTLRREKIVLDRLSALDKETQLIKVLEAETELRVLKSVIKELHFFERVDSWT